MTVLAIDPGNRRSAYVILRDGRPYDANTVDNSTMLDILRIGNWDGRIEVVIEQVACMGMSVGEEVFETVFWTGRFFEAASHNCAVYRLKRMPVKMHLCGNSRAKDANIRQALIDKFGPGKEAAIGTKKSMGPLHGIKGDEWQALALGVTFAELRIAPAPAAAGGEE